MNRSLNVIARFPLAHRSMIESLEHRRLLSGNWTTVDSDPNGSAINGLAADRTGKVYSVGSDVAGNATLREESAGQWTTLLTMNDNGGTRFNRVATDAAGDVFIAGNRQ